MARLADRAFYTWYTSAEWASDHRTGALALLQERKRTGKDRPGKNKYVWDWEVHHNGAVYARGTAQTQGAARRKARDAVGPLPDDKSPDVE